MSDMNRITDKIRKLLAMANDARGNEQERDTALRQAYALLVKHNLDMADVEASAHEAEDPRIKNEFESWSQKWAKGIFHSMAKLFFCTYYSSRKINATKCRHVFVGRSGNATTAALMGEYIVTSILRECRRNYVHNLAPESRSFAIGAADRIWQRVVQLTAQTQAEASPGTALVLVDLYKAEANANEAFIKEQGTELVVKKTRQADVNLAAYTSGHRYGNTVSLNKQVGTTEAPKAIK